MSENLKPCPFCGGSGKVGHFHGLWHVQCQYRLCGIASPGFMDQNDAVKWWNTRRHSPEVQAVIDAVAAYGAVAGAHKTEEWFVESLRRAILTCDRKLKEAE